MSDVVINFQPADALLGGAFLGVATVGKLLLTGRILGISGSFKGTVVDGDLSGWRFAFIGGLVASGLFDGLIFDPLGVNEPLPGLPRLALAGLLVGAGSGMGNGCTSGHGICGNSRFSPRSMAFTGLFMATGFATATLFDTNAALHIVSSSSAVHNIALPAKDTVVRWTSMLGTSVLTFLGLGLLANRLGSSPTVADSGSEKTEPNEESEPNKAQRIIALISEGLAGLVFGFGLTISGMRRPAKVSGFLSALEPSWDPSLGLVMAGAMALAIPGFMVAAKQPKPACRKQFDIPKNRKLERKLVMGGMLFGAGWGLAGLCPGPAIVSLAARPTVGLAVWFSSVVAGMWIQNKIP